MQKQVHSVGGSKELHEVTEAYQPFRPFPAHILKTKSDVLNEAKLPCSRFRAGFAQDKQLDIKIAQLIEKFDRTGTDLRYVSGTPLNWQLMLEYLYEQGLVQHPNFIFNNIRNDLPKLYTVSLHAPAQLKSDGVELDVFGFGSMDSIDVSMSKAVGELLERFHLANYRRSDLLVATYEQLRRSGKKTIDLSQINDFLPWQKSVFPSYVRTAESEFSWVRGKEFKTNRDTYIPAQFVYWNYRFVQKEPFLAQPTTNGAAGHFSRDEAIVAGLLEYIQRDGFMIYWLNSLSPKVIDPSSIVDETVRFHLGILERYGLRYYLLNTTSDILVPSCTCVIVDERADEPFIVMGSGSGFDLKDVLIQSIREALSVLNATIARPRYSIPSDYKPFTLRIIGRDQRLTAWHGKEMLKRFNFFISGSLQKADDFIQTAPELKTPKEKLAYLQEQLQAMGSGYEIYVFDARSSVLDTLGYHVVQTFVPRLMHLYLNENMATLDAPRLREVPAKIGYEPAVSYNPWPHPFP